MPQFRVEKNASSIGSNKLPENTSSFRLALAMQQRMQGWIGLDLEIVQFLRAMLCLITSFLKVYMTNKASCLV